MKTFLISLALTRSQISGKAPWLMPLAILCYLVNAATAGVYEKFTYTDNGTTITITDYPETEVGAVDIPPKIPRVTGKPVTRIGDFAFGYCAGLTSVTIPTGVTSIGNYAFYICTSLTSVTIPTGVTSIGMDAFSNCSKLTSVTIPNSVTSIGSSAFNSCTSLTSVTIPDSVTSIGSSAFNSCTSLTSVTIPNSVTSIGSSAFNSCTSLTSVTIPDSVTSIEDAVFLSCTSLTSVTIGTHVTTIGTLAFNGCSKLTSVTIPASVTSIVSPAFYDCTSLTSISVEAANPNYSSADGVMFNKLKTSLIQCPEGKTGGYTISASVTSIGESAFYNCTSLTSISVEAANPNYSSADGVLCNKLQTALIQCPDGKPGSYTIPASVTSIGYHAFYNCTGLTSISVEAANPNYSSEDGVLFDKLKTSLIRCPGGKVGAYTIPPGVTSIRDNAFPRCTSLTSVTIPTGVTSIENYTFDTCSKLTSITIPNSVTSIGTAAFRDCTSLTSVTIGNGVTSIGGYAFYHCNSLTSVAIPNSVTSIGSSAFYSCTSLTSVTIPTGVTSIGKGAFYDCTTLTRMHFLGNAPSMDMPVVWGASDFTVYYHHGKTGFTSPWWNGYPAYPCYLLSTSTLSNGAITGIASGGFHQTGTTATITAVSAAGFVFTGWTGDAAGMLNPLSVLMYSDKTIGATFAPDTNDTDGDDLGNYDEVVTYGTNPALKDTDGDGLEDGLEVGLGHFSVVAGSFTWAQALADAHARGGELACFPTAARWARAMESLGVGATDNFTGLWIGASDASTEGIWTWVNGETFTFSNWATSRPSAAIGNGLDYAEVSGGGGAELDKWYDRTASFIRDGYILETGYITNPTKADSDGDGINDGAEITAGTNPIMADTDGDGYQDGAEVECGSNPLVAVSVPEFQARTVSVPSAGTIQISFPAQQGMNYSVMESLDLEHWDDLETNIIGQGAVITRTYSTVDQTKRFLRVGKN